MPEAASSYPTLIGRARELAALRDALSSALAGRGSLVLIGGEAGIGKTTLAEALLAEAAEQGALILVGRCYDLSETPPYGPWVEALARAPRGDGLPAPPDLTGGDADSQSTLFAQVRDYLAALAASHPIVCLLEDLHWADPASLETLRVVGRQLPDLSLLLLATFRGDELTRRHPLYQRLPALEREARAARFDLRPLGVAALHTLAARYALPDADAARLVTWLTGRAEGNAFFIAQLLRALEDEGTLRPGAGGWALGDLGAVGLPAPLRQVLDARLARLGDEPHRLLTLAAVVGQEVPLATWAAVAETDEDGLMDTVERAVEARLLAETADGQGVRFAHALVREALYAGLLASRRRRVHRRAAEALAATPAPDPDAVAYHLQRAGDPRAAAWLVKAGERAWRSYAWLTAAERYEAALALRQHQGDDAGERALLLLTLAQLRRYDEPRRGITLAEEAARLADAAGDAALAAAARFDGGHFRCLASTEPQQGLAEMAAALPVLDALSPEIPRSFPAPALQGASPDEDYHRGALTHWLAMYGRYAEAVACGTATADRAPRPSARGLLGLGLAQAALGRPEEAHRAFAAARAAFRRAGQHLEVGDVASFELVTVALPYAADWPEALQRLAAEAEAAWARGAGAHENLARRARHFRGPLLRLAGWWDELLERGWGHWAVGWVHRARGERAAAWQHVGASLPEGLAAPPGAAAYVPASEALRLAVALALDADDLDAARAWLAAHDRWLAWSGAVLGQAEGQLGWVAYQRAAGDLADAREHAARALAHASAPRQPLALLAAHRTLGELDTAAGRHAAAQPHLATALALADACAAPYERALTLLALTELRLATGDRSSAATALDEASALLAPLGARPALARAAALVERLAPATTPPAPTLPFGLTAREAEVLRLVVAGSTNIQAAERLSVTPRTVGAHLTAIYTKLGVDNRAAAIRVALDHDLR